MRNFNSDLFGDKLDFKKLDKRFNELEEIDHWGEPALVHGWEQKIYKDIKEGLEYFYMKDYANSKNHKKVYEARYQLSLQAQIITVLAEDSVGFSMGNVRDIRIGSLVSISYKTFEASFRNMYPKIEDREKWIPVWCENYNDWLNYYMPKIYYNICS